MRTRYCTNCEEEFRPEILRCSDCGGELEDRYEAQLRPEPATQVRRPLTCKTQFFVVVHFELRATSARKGFRR